MYVQIDAYFGNYVLYGPLGKVWPIGHGMFYQSQFGPLALPQPPKNLRHVTQEKSGKKVHVWPSGGQLQKTDENLQEQKSVIWLPPTSMSTQINLA